MRTLYLIRHGQPLVQERHTCGYTQDIPLSETGVRQVEELREWAREKPITAIYTSPALRCIQTAERMADGCVPVHGVDGLSEMDTGAWTGLPFAEIKKLWPAEYDRRGQSIGTYPPPGGESFAQAGERMEQAVSRLLSESEGDVVIVAHGGVNRGWLCRLLGCSPNRALTLPQPWGGFSEIQLDGGHLSVRRMGIRPRRCPCSEEIEALWERYNTPAPVREHCVAVARKALELAEQTKQPSERELLNAACLLHDLVRDWPDHARACGELMTKEGWPELGAVIAVHHDLPERVGTEAALLYLADKLVQGDRPVSLEERFGAKRALCGMPEALAAWERRYWRARQAAEELGLTV